MSIRNRLYRRPYKLPYRRVYRRPGRLLYKLVHHVLIDEWDPIGVGRMRQGQAEYDSYIPGIIHLLDSGADKVKLADHLHELVTVNMGLRRDRWRSTLVAARLLEIYSELVNHQ